MQRPSQACSPRRSPREEICKRPVKEARIRNPRPNSPSPPPPQAGKTDLNSPGYPVVGESARTIQRHSVPPPFDSRAAHCIPRAVSAGRPHALPGLFTGDPRARRSRAVRRRPCGSSESRHCSDSPALLSGVRPLRPRRTSSGASRSTPRWSRVQGQGEARDTFWR